MLDNLSNYVVYSYPVKGKKNYQFLTASWGMGGLFHGNVPYFLPLDESQYSNVIRDFPSFREAEEELEKQRQYNLKRVFSIFQIVDVWALIIERMGTQEFSSYMEKNQILSVHQAANLILAVKTRKK